MHACRCQVSRYTVDLLPAPRPTAPVPHVSGSRNEHMTRPISPFSAWATKTPSLSTPTSGNGKLCSSSIRPTSCKMLRVVSGGFAGGGGNLRLRRGGFGSRSISGRSPE